MKELDSSLERYLRKLRFEVESRPYSYWRQQDYPITYEGEFEGRETQVEIDALEITPEYVLLQVNASNCPMGWYYFKGVGVRIDRCPLNTK